MSYLSTVLADAPQAFWPLTEPLRGTYTLFHDVTGHGYDAGLLVGTATPVPAPFGHGTAPFCGFTVPPTSDAIWLTHTLGLPVDGDAYTIEGWINPVLNYAFWMSLFSYGLEGYRAGYFLGIDIFGDWFTTVPHTGRAQVETNGPRNDVGLSQSAFPYDPQIMDGAWHYIAVTDDAAGTVSLYVDGTLYIARSGVGTHNGVVYNAANVLCIGDPGPVPANSSTYRGPAEEPSAGAYSHWALYTHALSSGQVAAHYAAAGSAGGGTGYAGSLRLGPGRLSGQMTWDGDGRSAPAPTVPLSASARSLRALDAGGNLLWSHDGTVFQLYKYGQPTTDNWGA